MWIIALSLITGAAIIAFRVAVAAETISQSVRASADLASSRIVDAIEREADEHRREVFRKHASDLAYMVKELGVDGARDYFLSRAAGSGVRGATGS